MHADFDKENGPFWEAAKVMCDTEIVKWREVLSLRRRCRREER
jgi:hypothetical protein